MDKKPLSVVSYITIIGWLIAYFSSKDLNPKPSLVKYHLKQGLAIFIVAILFNIAMTVIASIVPALSILSLAGLVFLVFMVIGAINASNEKEIPVPVFGKMFENKFSFLN